MAGKLMVFLLVAVTALSIAFSASPAEAEITFTMPRGGTLEGQRIGSDEFVAHGLEINCNELVFYGDFDEKPSGNSRSLGLHPEYAGCRARALSGLPADFYQETCDYLLQDLRRMKGERRWKAIVDLKCSGEYDSVGWTIFETDRAYKESRSFCFIEMPEKAGIGTAELRNLGGRRGGIEVRWNLDNFEYSVATSRGSGSSLLCGSTLGGTESDAHYRGTATVFAKDQGQLADLSLSG